MCRCCGEVVSAVVVHAQSRLGADQVWTQVSVPSSGCRVCWAAAAHFIAGFPLTWKVKKSGKVVEGLGIGKVRDTCTHSHFTAIYLELPGCVGTRRNCHPLTSFLLISQPLSTSSIYHNPQEMSGKSQEFHLIADVKSKNVTTVAVFWHLEDKILASSHWSQWEMTKFKCDCNKSLIFCLKYFRYVVMDWSRWRGRRQLLFCHGMLLLMTVECYIC